MPGGRPLKLNRTRLDKAERILYKENKEWHSEDNAIILTDEELCLYINEWLKEEHQISYRTFRKYKKRLKGNIDDNWDYDESLAETLVEFGTLYKKALWEQKTWLFNKLKHDEKAWQRWAWIIERKFTDWNLRHIWETTHKGDKDSPLFDKIVIEVKD